MVRTVALEDVRETQYWPGFINIGEVLKILRIYFSLLSAIKC